MFRKKDLILIAVLLAVAAVSALLAASAHRGAGASVRITVDGKLYGVYCLTQECEIAVDGGRGHNTLVIAGGCAYMAEADCPDGYCMDYRPIARVGEMIVCLPHRLVAEVTGDAKARKLDVVVP